jgi:molybdopterin molybdotransferase
MISVSEARKIIIEHTDRFSSSKVPLEKAGGHVLAEDIYSPIDMPAYPQSSMDGYALTFGGYGQYQSLEVIGVVAAGNPDQFLLHSDKAVRIFTGAPVPEGADTVVIQEKSRVENGLLIIDDQQLKAGDNVRAKGSEIKTGALALAQHAVLTPAAIGFLAGLGITEVNVYSSPVVSIIVTGNELQQPGLPLKYGQVYESNSFTLKAALARFQISDVKILRAEDSLEKLSGKLREALSESDIVLLTGGISVGDYDFVLQASEQCGITRIFHKIKQKPGKPIYFGKKGKKLIFGLPGNPASVLTCFYEYVCPAIEKLTMRSSSLKTIHAPLNGNYKKAAGLTHFLKGFYDGHTASFLDAQESFRLSSFARANCLIVIPEETTECKQDEIVALHLLPL